MQYLKRSWPFWLAAGLLGLCQVGRTVESTARKASQLEAEKTMRVVYDLEKETSPWCVLALLNGEFTAEGELGWEAGEAAMLGEREFRNLGYGLTDPTGLTTAAYRGEVYTVEPLYEEPTVGMYSFGPGKEALSVKRTCHNVEIIVH